MMATDQLLSPSILDDIRDAIILGGDANRFDADAAMAVTGKIFGSETRKNYARAAKAEITGAGVLQPWLEITGVTDVMVNGPGSVWVDRQDQLDKVEVNLQTESAVRTLAVRLAALAGQRLDDAAPICDGTLPDGTRLHAVLAPLAGNGTTISLRVSRLRHLGLPQLLELGMFPEPWFSILKSLVAGRANILISGGTGTGKTTLLSALLQEMGQAERLITVEEARELSPPVIHHIPLIARKPNVEGAGEVGLADLVKAALRMRPDRLVLGECRGGEVREVLQAMNTGHDGSLVTLHANSASSVPARLEALGALAGMTANAIAAQAASSIDVILHVNRGGGARRIAEIAVPTITNGTLSTKTVASWMGLPSSPTYDEHGWREFEARWRQ
jgi:pilus assembly protein CpaF